MDETAVRMSAEAAILEAVARVAVAVLGPAIEAALRGGEPEEAVIARLTAPAPVVRDTTTEDAARRARLALVAASVSRVSVADVDAARRLAQSATLSGEERAAVLRLAAHTEHALRAERSADDTRETTT